MASVHFVHKNEVTLNQLFPDDENSVAILKVANAHCSDCKRQLSLQLCGHSMLLAAVVFFKSVPVLDIYMVSTATC